MIRILVVDDHPMIREGLVAVLDTQPDFEVVGQASNGIEMVEQVQACEPDVVLLDLDMPGSNGVDGLQRLKAAGVVARVIVFTALDTDEQIVAAVQAGAQGYLLKGAPREQVFDAVRVVHGGGSLLQPVVASKLLRHLSGDSQPVEALTPREQEVLELLARGLQNKEIALALHISERTVKFHVSAVMGKLGAGNRTEAVRVAVQRGLVSL